MITDQMVEAALQAYCGQDHQLDFGALPDHFAAMRAALEAAEATAWQPIETAPRDGSQYLLYFPNGDVWGVYYDSEGTADWWPPGLDNARNCATQNRVIANEPTHWRPLPAASKEINNV